MQKVDYRKIMEEKGLDMDDVARHLFPDNNYPRLAWNRVLSGYSNMTVEQLSKFAALAGITIGEVFELSTWKSTAKDGIITFTEKDFVATFDTKEWKTTLFHKGSIYHEVIHHQRSIVLSEYLEELNTLINKIK